MAETGANYTHIVPGEGLYGLLSQISGVPTTLFVDSNGKQVGTAYIGAQDLDGWKAIVDELLGSLEAMSRRSRDAIAAALAVLGAVFVGIGIALGENEIVLRKAINICLECIGLG